MSERVEQVNDLAVSRTLDPLEYRVAYGSLQCYIVRQGNESVPMFTQHYGRAEYDRNKPILTESLRRQGQEVCDLLNARQIDEREARERLSRIYF